MSYKKAATISDADKHTTDVPVLLLQNGKLFSGGNDGKIKVSEEKLPKMLFNLILARCI